MPICKDSNYNTNNCCSPNSLSTLSGSPFSSPQESTTYLQTPTTDYLTTPYPYYC